MDHILDDGPASSSLKMLRNITAEMHPDRREPARDPDLLFPQTVLALFYPVTNTRSLIADLGY
jgi:hypothetical protein